MATFLELLSSNFVIKYYFGPNFDFWSQLSNSLPPAGGGLGRGSWGKFYYLFWGRGVVATFLELFSSNFVCKYHFGANFDF